METKPYKAIKSIGESWNTGDRVQTVAKAKRTESHKDEVAEKIETIAAIEHKEEFENIMPLVFHGINTINFGNTINNPYLLIKEIVVDGKQPFEDRTQGIRYMQRIPHKDRSIHLIESFDTVIMDEQYALQERYFFFSNNLAYIKLDHDLVNRGHYLVYFKLDTKVENTPEDVGITPFIYKLLSAQFIISQFVLENYNVNDMQQFLIDTAENENEKLEVKAQCADILANYGYSPPTTTIDGKKKGREIIEKLGYSKDRLPTIFTFTQNVHHQDVASHTQQTLNVLFKLVKEYEEVVVTPALIIPELDQNINEEVLKKVLHRITIDTATYKIENGPTISLYKVLSMIWLFINNLAQVKDRHQLIVRLYEEFLEMDETCTSGHLARMLNSIQGGYHKELPSMQISYKEQLKANVYGRLNAKLRSLPVAQQNLVVEEMMVSEGSHDTTDEFLGIYEPIDELEKEFVYSGFMRLRNFKRNYKESVNSWAGFRYYNIEPIDTNS